MLDFFDDVPLSHASIAWIARGLRECAMVDGVHPKEAELIQAFEEAAGLNVEADATLDAGGAAPFTSDAEREAYLRSLLLLCLADGTISEGEAAWVAEEAQTIGVDAVRLFKLDREARMYMLSAFKGVSAFRAEAEGIGRSLGLTDDEITLALS